MKLIGASSVIVGQEIKRDYGIIFDRQIVEIAPYKELESKYPKLEKEFYKHSVIAPGLINAHIHFEFGANITQFRYGDFGRWLDSLMTKREDVLASVEEVTKIGIATQLNCGVTSVGAISSYGGDMIALSHSPLKVKYFSEAIGSNASMIDFLYGDLKRRFMDALKLQNDRFTSCLAIHSPYSVHYKMTEKIIELAKEYDTILSAHFLESKHEKEWLDNKSGYFKAFLERLNIPSPKPFYDSKSFLKYFEDQKVLFTHCLEANQEILDIIASQGSFVVSCPRSNRLLCSKLLNLEYLKNAKLDLIIATDGKSSNNSVDLLEEARMALFGYVAHDLLSLAVDIFDAITINPAKALGLNNGILAQNKDADLCIYDLDLADIQDYQDAILSFILHAKEVSSLYISGEQILNKGHK